MLIIAVVIFGGWKLWNIYYEDYNSKQEETSIKNTKKIESQTIQEEGLPTIYIDLDGAEEEYYQNNLEAMIWEVKQQPSYLLKNCSSIYYQSLSSLNEQGGVAYSENTYMTVHIPLDTEENIVGNTFETSESKKSEKYSIRSSILSHELWHIYDFTHGDGNYPLTLCSND